MSHESDSLPPPFASLWQEFLVADGERKREIGFQLCDKFSGPEATETICVYLSQTNREELSINCQWDLLLCLYRSPSQEAIKIADIYLDADEPDRNLLETAVWIIKAGTQDGNLLTLEQKRDYAQRMKEAMVRGGDYDIADVVPTIVDFEGEEVSEETIDWLCSILEHHHPLVRGASEAFDCVLKIRPIRVAGALFSQLRNTEPDHSDRKEWTVPPLIFALEVLNQKGLLTEIEDDDLGLLIDSIIEVRNLLEPYGKSFTDAILERGETVRAILSRLPDDSASKKAIAELLEGA